MNVSNSADVLAFICYESDGKMKVTQFCQSLLKQNAVEAILMLIFSYLEIKLGCQNVGVSTDGAPAMLGRCNGLSAYI
jgi:hypothetical protein